jgi:hypothetical protein
MAEDVELTQLQAKLRWPLENDLPAVYANHASIIVSEHEVTVLFGSFLPTGMHNRNEEEVEEFLGKVSVQPVAKIVMTKQGFESVYHMLEKYAVGAEQ